MHRWMKLLTGLAGLITLVALFASGRPLEGVFAVLAAAGCLGWGLLVLTLPWDLHFHARAVLAEIDRSTERGLRPRSDPAVIRRIARRTLGFALLAHLASAGAVLGLALWLDWSAGPLVAAAYLASATFRPIGAWYAHLRAQLGRAMNEATHPRDDVLAMKSRLESVELRAAELDRALAELAESTRRADERTRVEAQRLDQRLDQVGRRFEASIERLTDDRELLAGLRAFLRMIRETPI